MSGRPDWRNLAACLDTVAAGNDPFFSGTEAGERKALAICRLCRVRGECLDFAVQTGQVYGVWGGRSQREVRRMVAAARKGRTLDEAAPTYGNAAKTHCKHGHPFNETNTYYATDGQRRCRACFRIAQAADRRARRLANRRAARAATKAGRSPGTERSDG